MPKKKRALTRPPSAVPRIGALAVAASGVHFHEVFKVLRICEETLERIITDAGQPLPQGDNEPMADDLAAKLRAATEEQMNEALANRCVALPITSAAELLEAFNCVLDTMGVPDEDGDVFAPE